MCGRFAITLPSDAMAQLFEAQPSNDLPEVPNYNVCPTAQISVVSAGETGRRLEAMRWGFLPHWYKSASDGPLLINARAETLAEKPAFKGACRERRCLIAMSGFYEWTKDPTGARLPWYIARRDQAPLVVAGIWQDWVCGADMMRTCAMVTCAANTQMSAIHHRMPVVLEPDQWAKWLGEEGHGAARLMWPVAGDVLTWFRVSTDVNSNRSSGAQLCEPLDM